ncbi:MAG: HNH endonuclease [Acidimicrobiales bacterium]
MRDLQPPPRRPGPSHRAKARRGTDDASNAVPLCPNCHDEVHAGYGWRPPAGVNDKDVGSLTT